MQKREFNKILNSCRTKDKKDLDLAKIDALNDETKASMTMFIVRHREPILKNLISPLVDKSWLASCAYFHETQSPSNGMVFVHTAEHTIH